MIEIVYIYCTTWTPHKKLNQASKPRQLMCIKFHSKECLQLINLFTESLKSEDLTH